LLGVRPDGNAVELPPTQVPTNIKQGHRFLPDGQSLVYVESNAPAGSVSLSHDFWLMDLRSKTKRQIARLASQDSIGTFDISPDGKRVVFDRSRENSDIVLIELPRR